VLKIKAKENLKSVRIEKLTQNVYTGSLFTKSYIQSLATTENSLSNQNLDYTQHTKVVILNPSRTHTTFGNTTLLSEQPLKLHNTNSHKITVIKKEKNRVHMDTIKY